MPSMQQSWNGKLPFPKFAFQKVQPGDGADINIAFVELSGTMYGFAYAPPNGSLFLDIDTNFLERTS